MSWILFALVAALAVPATALADREDITPATAPAFQLPTRGGAVDSDSLRGKLILVDFWASWCSPCRRSFPWMSALHAKYGARGLEIVAINLDKKQEPTKAFLARYPAPFTVAFDPAGKTAEAFQVTAMPSTFLISTDGRILSKHAGFDPRKAAALEALIVKTLPR